ncbi:unnamed protein product, partial [Meganyctiphanes norvegica]
MASPTPWRCGVLTVSDRCSRGEAEDTSGKNLQDLLNEGKLLNAQVVSSSCVPDELTAIKKILLQWCDDGLQLIITTGGTGFAPRDVTPEAVKQVSESCLSCLSLLKPLDRFLVTPWCAIVMPLLGIFLVADLRGPRNSVQFICKRFLSACLPHALQVLTQQNTHVDATHKQLQSQGVQHQHSQHQHHCHHHHNHHHSSKADVSRVSRRARKSPYPMISVEEAQKMVLTNAERCNTKMVPMAEALGSVLAQDVYAKDALPPFPASIKDGYAVLAADGAGLRTVAGDSTAGAGPNERKVTAGVCVRVNTGAPVPPGADAVVQVEDTELTIEEDDGRIEREIRILRAPTAGQDIRPTGCDIKAGQCILSLDTRLGPAELGLLAAVGVVQVSVYEAPTIAVLSTGNELQEPGEDLREGHIRDSNKTTLMALIKQSGFQAVDSGIAQDQPSVLLEALRLALARSDILVTTGSVSMGERDILRPVLQADLNATIHFAQVFMKPGKPTTFATCTYEGRKKLILGLPGNPVSATVTAHLYLIPAARKMAGRTDYMNTTVRAKLGSEFRIDPRPEYHRCTLHWSTGEDLPTAQSTGNQLSSRLLSCASAQALLKLPHAQEERTTLPQGHIVEAILL